MLDILGYDSFAFINCGVFLFYLKRHTDSVAMFQAENAQHFRWHRTPTYCDVLRIGINNKIKYYFIYFPSILLPNIVAQLVRALTNNVQVMSSNTVGALTI